MMIVFWMFVCLSSFSAGVMLVLQVQHFGLYPLVGKEGFAAYIAANNRAAVFPAICAALVLMVLSIVLLFDRPPFLSAAEAAACVALNLTNIDSTIVWQGRIHARLARTGYDDDSVNRLIQTNWVRTAALLLQAFIAFAALLRVRG
jgi:hypothetical protein